MSLRVLCPNGHLLEVQAQHVGMVVRCPLCNLHLMVAAVAMPVPAASAVPPPAAPTSAPPSPPPPAPVAPPANLEPGKIVERVVCAKNLEQSYALYLPSNYSPDRAWSIVFVFDPGARGKIPVELMKEAAERYGFIAVASNNSRNGPWKMEFDAADAMVRRGVPVMGSSHTVRKVRNRAGAS